ncbi:MAG TPA: protein kinase [Bryobacteraceae bacterium]|jgi:serine/threonine protein kinase
MIDLFHAARERTAEERIALLNSACTDDPEIRLAVEQMLRDDEASCSLLDRPAIARLAGVPQLRTMVTAAGARFGRYEILDLIGCGGMGEVWKAHDTELDRPVALKFLFSVVDSSRLAELLTHEARAASALNHPNIVTIHEVIRHEETPIIVMELVEGQALRAITGSPQPIAQVMQYGVEVARALAAAHAHGIVHCDIKPENILVRSDGYVKVLDFGLACRIENEAVGKGVAGTLRYMSPEQLRGESVSPASDIFSLGLVLYELAAGQHAFDARPLLNSVHEAVGDEVAAPSVANPVANPLVPTSLESLILTMLARNPEERPSADEVAGKLAKNLALAEEQAVVQKPPPQKQAPRRLAWLAALAACVVLIYLAWATRWAIFGQNNSSEFTDLQIRPLTSQPGWEAAPALSPDGQSVAFTWTPKLDRPKQIYVKRLDDSEPVRLTNSESEGNIGYLAWSPDGRQIAFKRQSVIPGAIYSIASTGGNERKIVDLANANLSSAIDWSPDGTKLAFSDTVSGRTEFAIYLFDLRTGAKRQLTSPPSEIWGDWNPKFSPDGLAVAFKRVIGFWADDIYMVRTAGGSPRRITNGRRGIWGHAWTANGRSLIVSWQRSSTVFGIWRIPLKEPGRPESIAQGGVDSITPSTARNTNRLAWVNQLWDLNIYRISATGVDAPTKLIASTLRDQGATYSADGRIAFISDRSGSREIWMAKGDGSNQVQVTHFNGPQLDHLRWSPDGRSLAFDGRPFGSSDIFTVTCDWSAMRCGESKRLISGEAPSWSADGKFIYFATGRSGRQEIWMAPVSGGSQPVQVTHNGAYMCRESADGKWRYLSRNPSDGIWKMPGSNSGTGATARETLVIGPPYRVQSEGWTITPNEIVFIDRATSTQPAAIRAYNIATKQVRHILALSELFPDRGDIGVSVSPDSRWVLYSQLDRSGSDIIIADHGR